MTDYHLDLVNGGLLLNDGSDWANAVKHPIDLKDVVVAGDTIKVAQRGSLSATIAGITLDSVATPGNGQVTYPGTEYFTITGSLNMRELFNYGNGFNSVTTGVGANSSFAIATSGNVYPYGMGGFASGAYFQTAAAYTPIAGDKIIHIDVEGVDIDLSSYDSLLLWIGGDAPDGHFFNNPALPPDANDVIRIGLCSDAAGNTLIPGMEWSLQSFKNLSGRSFIKLATGTLPTNVRTVRLTYGVDVPTAVTENYVLTSVVAYDSALTPLFPGDTMYFNDTGDWASIAQITHIASGTPRIYITGGKGRFPKIINGGTIKKYDYGPDYYTASDWSTSTQPAHDGAYLATSPALFDDFSFVGGYDTGSDTVVGYTGLNHNDGDGSLLALWNNAGRSISLSNFVSAGGYTFYGNIINFYSTGFTPSSRNYTNCVMLNAYDFPSTNVGDSSYTDSYSELVATQTRGEFGAGTTFSLIRSTWRGAGGTNWQAHDTGIVFEWDDFEIQNLRFAIKGWDALLSHQMPTILATGRLTIYGRCYLTLEGKYPSIEELPTAHTNTTHNVKVDMYGVGNVTLKQLTSGTVVEDLNIYEYEPTYYDTTASVFTIGGQPTTPNFAALSTANSFTFRNWVLNNIGELPFAECLWDNCTLTFPDATVLTSGDHRPIFKNCTLGRPDDTGEVVFDYSGSLALYNCTTNRVLFQRASAKAKLDIVGGSLTGTGHVPFVLAQTSSNWIFYGTTLHNVTTDYDLSGLDAAVTDRRYTEDRIANPDDVWLKASAIDGIATDTRMWHPLAIVSTSNTQVHTAGGKSWYCLLRNHCPKEAVQWQCGEVAVRAGVLLTISVWVYNTGVGCTAAIRSLPGQVGSNLEVDVESTYQLNVWQELTTTMTPTSDGVMYFYVTVWGDDTKNLYVDDFKFEQI